MLFHRLPKENELQILVPRAAMHIVFRFSISSYLLI